MRFEKTATRLWRRLEPGDRLAAAESFWRDPGSEVGGAIAALVRARHLRPQVARSLDEPTRARYLSMVLDPGESVAAALLVALHLADRRDLLGRFLDALGLPHEQGVLTEQADPMPPPAPEAARRAVAALASAPADHVRTYLNTLWLQDPERWAALPEAYEASGASTGPASSREGNSSQ